MSNDKPAPLNWHLLAVLRFLLACVVASGHSDRVTTGSHLRFLEPMNGAVAVIGFLLISGMSIRHSIENKPSGYMVRRWRRIMPTYWTAFALSMIPWAFVPDCNVRFLTGETVWAPTPREFLCSAFLLQGVFSPLVATMGTAWTLIVEEWLYAAAPLLRRFGVAVILALATASGVYYFLISGQGRQEAPWGVFLMGWPWLLGFAVYPYRNRTWARFAVLLIPAFIIAPWSKLQPFSGFTMLLTSAALVYGHEVNIPARFHTLCQWLGDISYEVYLFGWSVMLWTWKFWPSAPWWAYPAITLSISAVVLHAIDRPMRKPQAQPAAQEAKASFPALPLTPGF